MGSTCSRHTRKLILLVLLLAASGLAGHFLTDALCGSYLVTQHECQERRAYGSELLAQPAVHASFLLPQVSLTGAWFALVFMIAIPDLPVMAHYVPPPLRPPVTSL